MTATGRRVEPRPAKKARAYLGTFAPALALTVAACGGSHEWSSVGVSDGPPRAENRPANPPPTPSASWPYAAQLQALVSMTARPVPSRGHNPPRWLGVVRVSSGQRDTYREPSAQSSPWPVGTLLAEEHQAIDGATGPTFAMIKREAGFAPNEGDWQYAVLDVGGAVQSLAGRSLCAQCHVDAPHDHVFGSPSDAPVRPSARDAQTPGDEVDEGRSPAEDEGPASKTPAGKPPAKKKHGP